MRARRMMQAHHRMVGLAVLVLALGLGGVWWFADASERRVDRACDAWLGHRAALRTTLAETDEARGRAEAAQAEETASYFNDLPAVIGHLEGWEQASPSVLAGLEQEGDAEGWEGFTVHALTAVQGGIPRFRAAVEEGSPWDAEFWTHELGARFQGVDDACLGAARAG